MSKISRFTLRAILIVAVFLLTIFLYLNHGVTAFHHERIEAAISDASGFLVSSDQSFELSVGKELVFSATDLKVRHPDWPDTEPLASAKAIHFRMDIWSALTDPIPITTTKLDEVEIHLQEADGLPPNWSVDRPQSTQDEQEESVPAAHKIELAGIRTRSSMNGNLIWSAESDIQAEATLQMLPSSPMISVVINAPLTAISVPSLGSEDIAEPKTNDQLFSDEALDLSWLSTLALTADITTEQVTLNDRSHGMFTSTLSIVRGGLTVDQLTLHGTDNSLSGSLSVQPLDDAYDLTMSASLKNWRADFLAIEGEDLDGIPPFDGELELRGTGNSVQAIMAGANGRFSGRHSTGTVDLKAAGPLFSDVAAGLVQTLNPLAEASSQTSLDCGIYEITITDGLASVEQFSVQTDKLTVISSGEIDLGTEALDMALRTKSREGLGLSIGGVATSFFKLGGSLSEPSVEVDAGGTVTTAGAAVATGGLSVFAKGLWDRLSAEADLCELPKDEQPEATSSES